MFISCWSFSVLLAISDFEVDGKTQGVQRTAGIANPIIGASHKYFSLQEQYLSQAVSKIDFRHKSLSQIVSCDKFVVRIDSRATTFSQIDSRDKLVVRIDFRAKSLSLIDSRDK